jgi:type-F conjugative transfer system pilin assembly protein TrbC
MRFIYSIILISLTFPAFAAEMNDIAHQELLRREKIVQDRKNSDKNNELEGYKKAAVQNIKNYEPIIRPIQEQYIQDAKSKGLIKPAPRAVIFVSFSMPDLSLKQIINDAARYQIPVVIRGLIDNSFKKTAARVFELVKEKNKGGVLLNPLWFKQYAINTVPAFVVKEGDKFDVIYGNVRLEKLLEIIAANGSVSSVAQKILNEGRI